MESDRKIMIIDAGVRLNVYFVYAMFSCWLIDGIRSGCGFLFIVNDDSILRIENVKFIYFNVKHTQTRTQIHKTRERERNKTTNRRLMKFETRTPKCSQSAMKIYWCLIFCHIFMSTSLFSQKISSFPRFSWLVVIYDGFLLSISSNWIRKIDHETCCAAGGTYTCRILQI